LEDRLDMSLRRVELNSKAEPSFFFLTSSVRMLSSLQILPLLLDGNPLAPQCLPRPRRSLSAAAVRRRRLFVEGEVSAFILWSPTLSLFPNETHDLTSLSPAPTLCALERQNALTVQESEEIAANMLYVKRRDSEEALALLALEMEREATESIYDKVARLKEENRSLKLKVRELMEAKSN